MRGYRRIVMATEARDEADANTGEPRSWARLLPAMCEGRLQATPWLNKVGPPPPMANKSLYKVARAVCAILEVLVRSPAAGRACCPPCARGGCRPPCGSTRWGRLLPWQTTVCAKLPWQLVCDRRCWS